MRYRVIDTYDIHNTIELDGETYPATCLVQDEFGARIMIVPDYRPIDSVWWEYAHRDGALAILRAAPLAFTTAENFVEHRESQGVWTHFHLEEEYWTKCAAPLSSMEMLSYTYLTPPEGETGFCHLHTHSEHSALDGLSTVREMVQAAVADGQRALAITDHGVCAAHPALQLACQQAGIKPIFGLEAYFVDNRHDRGDEHRNDYMHLVLLAMTEQGLLNLWALSTESYRTGQYYKPRIDWDLLEKLGDGIIATTGCLRGPLLHPYLEGDGEEKALQNLSRLKSIFGDRLYIELHVNQLPQQIEGNKWLVEVSEKYDVPLVAVVDSHYTHEHERDLHRTWLSIQTNSDVQDDSSLFAGGQDYHLMTRAEVEKSLTCLDMVDMATLKKTEIPYLAPSVVREAILNTGRVADRCTAEMTGKDHNPIYSKPTEEWPDPVAHDVDRLWDLCFERWAERTIGKANSQDEYMARLEREMTLLIDKRFCGYFLMEWDIVMYAKRNGVLVGPGRGSGGGSLVAYLIGITEIDPVEADLLFERFLTDGRTELPDFDIDFPSSKKKFMLDYVASRWGEDHVCTVGTHLRLKNKAVINDTSRAMKSLLAEDAFRDMRAVSAIIDEAEASTAGLGLSWDELWVQAGEVLEPYRQKYPQVFEIAAQLHGRLKTYGKHAAGVIIDPENPLTGALPLRRGEDEEGMISQFDMHALVSLGFVKFDMLNIRNLDTIQDAVDLIRVQTGREITPYTWRDEYRDPQIWGEISDGWTLGMFQIETVSGTRLTRRFRPASLAELSDVITLVRPGPMRSGLTEIYFRRRNGDEEVSYADARLEAILSKTYGCFSTETRIVTREGPREIGQLAGGYHELMTTRGSWTKAEIRSFGVQPLRKITLRRNKQVKVIYATGNHRWFAGWNGSKDRDRELLTDELKPGMSFTAQMPWRPRRLGMSTFGVAAGVTFGDGTRTRWGSHVDLHGKKNAELLPYFNGSRTRVNTDQDRYAESYITVLDLPRAWKELPALNEGPSYLYGWLAGYFAADGCVSVDGRPTMASANKGALEHFRTVANLVGVGTYEITEHTNLGTLPCGRRRAPSPQYAMGLVSGTLSPEFFVLFEHRRRFAAAQEARQRVDRVRWTVETVEETERVEEVFCAVVPKTHAFVLEDHILTGNCMLYQEDIMAVAMSLAGYDSNEADAVRKILGKKKVELVNEAGEKFVRRSVANGTDREVAEHLWEQMAEFAKYCVSGDTEVHLAASGKYSNGKITIEELYRKINPPLLPKRQGQRGHTYTGPCVSCEQQKDGPYRRGLCTTCDGWLHKFRDVERGVHGLTLHADDRIRPARILQVHKHKPAPTWTVILADGRSITATANHRHVTPHGLRRVDELTVGDSLVVDAGYEELGWVPERDRVTRGERQLVGAVKGAFGNANHGYVDGGFTRLMAWTAIAPDECQECGHDGSEYRLERAHLDGDRTNNDPSNLRMWCVSCHKKYDYRINGSRRPWEKGHLSSASEIVSIEPAGIQPVYSLVMDDPHIWVANGVLTANSFGRAHAYAYAMLGFWTGWLKFHYPIQFLTAALSTVKQERVPEFVEEARRMGYSILPPDINESGEGFTSSPGRMAVRYGLKAVKGIGDAAVAAIIENRPYTSWEDFQERKGAKCNSGHIKTLVHIGAMDSLFSNRRALEKLMEAEAVPGSDRCSWKDPATVSEWNGLPCTFDWASEPPSLGRTGKPAKPKPVPKRCTRACRQFAPTPLPDPAVIAPYTDADIRTIEMDTLGVYLSSTPFDRIPEEDRTGLATAADVMVGAHGTYMLAVVLKTVRQKPGGDRNGNAMGWLTLTTERGEIDCVVFHSTWAKHVKHFKAGTMAYVALNKNDRGQTLELFEPLDI